MSLLAILEDNKRHSPEQIDALRKVRAEITRAILAGCRVDDVLHNAVEAAINLPENPQDYGAQ